MYATRPDRDALSPEASAFGAGHPPPRPRAWVGASLLTACSLLVLVLYFISYSWRPLTLTAEAI